jgi:hypothetical protein
MSTKKAAKKKQSQTSKVVRVRKHIATRRPDAMVKAPETFTAENLEALKGKCSKAKLAEVVNGRLVSLEAGEKLTFDQIGLLCLFTERESLWKELKAADGNPYHSFDAWMSTAKNGCRANRYAAWKVAKELTDISPAELKEMPRANKVKLADVPRKSRTPEVRKAARTLEVDSFSDYVEREIPDAHLDSKRPPKFKAMESGALKVIESALEGIMLLDEDITTREDALEGVCSDFITMHQDEIEEKLKARAAIA